MEGGKIVGCFVLILRSWSWGRCKRLRGLPIGLWFVRFCVGSWSRLLLSRRLCVWRKQSATVKGETVGAEGCALRRGSSYQFEGAQASTVEENLFWPNLYAITVSG